MMRIALQIWNNNKVYASGCIADREGSVIKWDGAKCKGKRVGTREEMDIDTLKRSAKRAYIKLVRTAESINVDRMITLTFAENIGKERLKETNACFRSFILEMEKKLGKLQYVAVPELQKRGAIHYHIGVNRFIHIDDINLAWKECVKAHGLVDDTGRAGYAFINKKATKYDKGVARYIAKYVFKGVNNAKYDITGFNGKRYYASKVSVVRQIIDYYGSNVSGKYHLQYGLLNVHGIDLDISKINLVRAGLFGYDWVFFEAIIKVNENEQKN